MAHGANGGEMVLHGQVNIAGSRESARPAVVSVVIIVATLLVHLFHHAQHHVVMIERETPARAHIAQHQAILKNLNRLLSGALSLAFRVVCVTFSTQVVHQLRHDGEDRHLPHDGRIPLAAHCNVQMSLLILRHGDLVRIEAIAPKEGEIPFWEVIHLFLHELYLLRGNHHLWHVAQLFFHQSGESLRINGVVAVKESVLNLCARILLQDVILTTEGISIVVGEVTDNLFHSFFLCCVFGKDTFFLAKIM